MLFYDLVLIRHGQSVGNVAVRKALAGDESDLTPEFLSQHTSEWRLTYLGRKQARLAGRWLKQNNYKNFDRYYASEYRRTIETAALLGFKDAKWEINYDLRERDTGLLGINSINDGIRKFADNHRQRLIQRFYGRMPDGESIADVCNRLRSNVIPILERDPGGFRVVIVTHGEVMTAFRVIFEHLRAEEFHQKSIENSRDFKIGNVQVIEYTRVNPFKRTSKAREQFSWVRSVNPFDQSYAGHDWREIKRPSYSNKELLKLANK